MTRDIKQFNSAFQFGNLVSTDYGVWISGEDMFAVPSQDYETIVVPGHPGEVLIDPNDPGRYANNIEIPVPAFIAHNFPQKFKAFRRALLGLRGYQRLRTTYHPGEYRLGYVKGGIQPNTGPHNDSGKFTILFSCMPQRWLDMGDSPISVPNGGALVNPTANPARPLIQVFGSGAGAITIGNDTLSLDDCDTVTLDSETEDAWRRDENMNLSVRGDYPVLSEGVTPVSWSGGVTSLLITPRWWDL